MEQKNDDVVRKTVGYFRFAGEEDRDNLAALYADARKWRESQQKENPRTEPGYGDQVGRGQVEKVNGAGGYRPENVFSYFNQAANR